MLAKEKYGLRGREISEHEAQFIPFSAYTRMSGVDIGRRMLRKGASSSIAAFVGEMGGTIPDTFNETADRISRSGGTPLAVADGPKLSASSILKTSSKAE